MTMTMTMHTLTMTMTMYNLTMTMTMYTLTMGDTQNYILLRYLNTIIYRKQRCFS